MDWDEIRFFLAVAKSGSLSAAARQLGVTQPTVGRKIRQLETRLDARLFDRVNHDHFLTRAGEAILDLATGIESDVVSIERKVSGKDTRPCGRLRLSTAECFGVFWVVPHLPRFKRRFPSIEVELKLGINALDVMRGECDISMALDSPTSEDLVGRRIGKLQFALFAAPQYLERFGTPRALHDLPNHRIIDAVGEIAELPHAQLLREMSSGAEVGFSSNSQTALFASVQIGLGLLALPIYMAHRAPQLKRVLRKEFDLRRDIWLLTHRDLRHTTRIRAMLDFLAEQFSLEQDSLLAAEPIPVAAD